MKPLSIELQAFGPFAGNEKVDFENLSRDGLFLIRGKTGSGKSMILDAICYALFGKSSGENRDNIFDLRCNRCDPDTDTYVRYTFKEKGTVYVFERSLKKARKNFSSKAGAYFVRDDGTLEPLFENPKEKEVTKKAEEIIGLSFDQFRQVIILPQGKFEKLLTSNSDDKEKILSSIFGTEKWQIMADTYYRHAKAKKDELDEIRIRAASRLAEEGCVSLEELKEKIQSAVRSKETEEEHFAEQDYENKEKLLNEAKAISGEFSTLNDYLKREAAIDGKMQSVEENRRKLENAQGAEPFRKPLEEKARTLEDLKIRKKDEEKAEELRKNAEKRVAEADLNLKRHDEKKEEYEGWKKDLTAFASKVPLYESLTAVAEKKTFAKENHARAVKALSEASKEYEYHVAETEKLYRSYEEAISAHKVALDSYMKEISGVLASELEDGMACPVCGSREHPAKAILPEGTVDRAYVDMLEATETQSKENWNNANESRIKSEKELEEKKKKEMQLKNECEMASADYTRIREGLIEGIDTLDELINSMKKLETGIAAYEYDGKKFEESVQSAALIFKGAQTSCENAATEVKKAEERYLNAKDACERLIAGSAFDSAEEAAKAMLPPEEQKRISNEIGEYDGQLLEIKKLIKEKQKMLDGVEEPDILQINTQIEEIRKAREEFNKSQGACIREIDRMKEKESTLKKEFEVFESEIQKAESNLIFAKTLRGDTGIGLHRYVLGIMFSSVIAAANEMLAKVHGGRYRLYRTDEKVAGSNKKGLDLKVHDSYSDGMEGRVVSTLSGGEKFLASLALSLGMSAVARSGGVHIEGMFIDEGFGTLDENSVEDALDVLKSIRKMNGSVGIISHMDVLGANIPAQLIVEKEKETSTIRLV